MGPAEKTVRGAVIKRESTVIVTCDVKDCAAEVAGRNVEYLDFYGRIRGQGWRRALSTSPHPPVSGQPSWAITLHFCPDHQALAQQPEAYVVQGAPPNRPDYVVRPREEEL